MSTVTNSLIDGTGRPLQDLTVRISLIAPLNPFLLNGVGEVIQRVAVDTDHNGVWSATLLANSTFEDPNTYYLVDETDAPSGHLWAILMPNDSNTHLLRDLLINAPVQSGPSLYEYALNDLTDVNTAGWQAGDVLEVRPDGQWVPAALPTIAAEFTQATPATVWTWVHGLGRYPLIDVLDLQRNHWVVAYQHLDINTVRVTWGTPATGYIEAR